MKNEIIKSSLSQQSGFCKYCGQLVIVKAPEDTAPEYLNELATENCTCREARRQQERNKKIAKALEWAQETFSSNTGSMELIVSAIKSVSRYDFDSITAKIGNTTYKIYINSDAMLCIKTACRSNQTVEF